MSPIMDSAETCSSKKDYNQRMEDSNMEPNVLVSEQDIIATYSKEEQLSCKQYAEYQELIRENPYFGYKRCAKLLGVSPGRTRWWHTKGTKKAIPIALKTVEKLKSAGFIPFTEEHEHARVIFNIFGTLFGDGGIDKRLNTMAFISSDRRDVDLWEQDLLKIFPLAKGKTSLVEGGEYGHSYNIRTFDRNIIRFFVALGVPVGSKIIIDYSLPHWIEHVKPALLACFLDGLVSSEVSIPRFVTTRYNTDYFKNFSLSLSKCLTLESNHIDFMDSLRKQFRRLGIKCTPTIRKDIYRAEKRKDGHESNGYRIFFASNIFNVLKFYKIFPLRYCHGKKEKFGKEAEKAIASPSISGEKLLYKKQRLKAAIEKALERRRSKQASFQEPIDSFPQSTYQNQ